MDNFEKLDQLRNKKRAFETLLKDPVYCELASFIESQIATRRRESNIAAQALSVDGNARAVGLLNEIAGLKLALAMPAILIDNINIDIESLEESDVQDQE